MTKQRWRESFESIIDNEEDEQLRATKTEIDDKVQKIYKFLKDGDSNDRKESLTDLIEDFHNHYESVYTRYDNLIQELTKMFHGKGGYDSSDSSHSDDSPAKKGKRNGKVEHNFENNTAVFERELETALLEVSDLRIKLAGAIDDKEELYLEYQSALSKRQESQRITMDLNEQLSTLKLKLESTENEIVELNQMQKASEDENTDLRSKIVQLEEELNDKSDEISKYLIETETLKEEKCGMGNNISEFENKLVERGVEVKSLQQELEMVQSEKSELKLQIERLNQESAESLAGFENQHNELLNKNIEQERKTKEQNDALIKLIEDHKLDIEAKEQDINRLEEIIEDLKTDLEMKEDEMRTLVENMRNTEVKQRLTTQKLRITEQLLGEMEENHQKKVEKLLEEQKSLDKRITSLSGIISTYKEAQVRMVTEISEKMTETFMGIDTFSVKFEEDYGHLESRIYEIKNELKVIRNWITGNNNEKDQLKKEIASLLQQLKDENEQKLLLRVKIVELEMILQKDEDERKILIQSMKQQEEKMGELERKMNEKDSGILSLSEEKKEAIKQLCIWSDYYHNRYDDLKDMILKTRGGRRQTAA